MSATAKGGCNHGVSVDDACIFCDGDYKLYRVNVQASLFVIAANGATALEVTREALSYRGALTAEDVELYEIKEIEAVAPRERSEVPWGSADDQTIAQLFGKER
jgi:hypothetical protein